MLSIALCLALAQDLEFERGQIESISAINLEQVLPLYEAHLIRLLGNDDGLVRDLAAEKLRSMGRAASAALAWGMRSKDPEIKSRATGLRDLLYLCPRCKGTGQCPACHGEGDKYIPRPDGKGWIFLRCPDNCNYYSHCIACGGSGDLRWRWDIDGTLIPANLFGTTNVK